MTPPQPKRHCDHGWSDYLLCELCRNRCEHGWEAKGIYCWDCKHPDGHGTYDPIEHNRLRGMNTAIRLERIEAKLFKKPVCTCDACLSECN